MNEIAAKQAAYSGDRLGYAQTQSGHQGYGDSTAGQRQLEVTHQFDMLRRNAQALSETFSQIESRLSESVLRPEPPSPSGAKGEIRGAPNTPLGGRLQDANDMLTDLRTRMESVLQRLEA